MKVLGGKRVSRSFYGLSQREPEERDRENFHEDMREAGLSSGGEKREVDFKKEKRRPNNWTMA